MKRKTTWQGHGGPVERVGVAFNTRIMKKAPKPAHTYGSPAWELKREEAEKQRLEAEAEAKAAAETATKAAAKSTKKAGK